MKKLAEFIKSNCDEPNTIFVFPLQVQAREWFIESLNITGKSALPEDAFISWNNFKKRFFETDETKNPISQMARKIFVEYILRENARRAKDGNAIFKKIILEKFANTSSNFTSWLVNILPQLDNLERKLKENNYQLDETNEYLLLKKHYEFFLERHSLYEPAWSTKKLTVKNENIKIIFPELIEDFYEVSDIISEAKNISLISVKNFFDKKEIQAIEFDNSRSEIEFCISNVEKLLTYGVAANDIAITVYDLDELKPYLKREAELRGIPIEFRAGEQLGKTQAGAVFKQILEVASSQYSFESLNELFFNTHLPWKHQNIIYELLQFGIENNCVVSWKDGAVWKNCWEEIFKLNESNKPTKQIELENFFAEFKTRINAIVKAKTFNDVKNNYIIFSKKFFDVEKLSIADDLILSRCIEKLKDLSLLEAEFANELSPERFRFFVASLDETNYVYQNTGSTVSVFPNKVMAISPFKYNFILNANQKDASVLFQNLLFLRSDVRDMLDSKDIDVSDLFLQCYNNCENSKISFSLKTFSDYAICHNSLEKRNLTEEESDLIKINSYLAEEKYFYNTSNKTENTFEVYSLQNLGAKNFTENFKHEKGFSLLKNNFPETIHSELYLQLQNRNYIEDNKFKISQSQLNIFTECSVKYFFNNVLRIQKTELPILIYPMELGNLSHNILKKLLTMISERDVLLRKSNLNIYKELAKKIITEEVSKTISINKAFALFLKRKKFDEVVGLLEYLVTFFDGYSIPVIEKTFTENADEYFLDGTIDCALYDEIKKTFALIDFKTNTTPKKGAARIKKDEDSLTDFQMAMYVLLLERAYIASKVNVAMFWSLNKKEAIDIVNLESGNAAFPRNDFDRSIENLFEHLDKFCFNLREYNFTKNKSVLFKQCAGCDYKNICRTTFQVEGE